MNPTLLQAITFRKEREGKLSGIGRCIAFLYSFLRGCCCGESCRV